jgi:hypothetical protein
MSMRTMSRYIINDPVITILKPINNGSRKITLIAYVYY